VEEFGLQSIQGGNKTHLFCKVPPNSCMPINENIEKPSKLNNIASFRALVEATRADTIVRSPARNEIYSIVSPSENISMLAKLIDFLLSFWFS